MRVSYPMPVYLSPEAIRANLAVEPTVCEVSFLPDARCWMLTVQSEEPLLRASVSEAMLKVLHDLRNKSLPTESR